VTKGIAFRHVDSFATEPLAGNPAAVFLLPSERDAAWCQAIAAEMKQTDTAFVVTPGSDGIWGLRWFTPTSEVDLCGHATLASAHVLWEDGLVPPGSAIRFSSRSGLLTATQAAGGGVELDLPAEPMSAIDEVPGLADALGASIGWLGQGRMYLLAELDSDEAVRALTPDLDRLASVTRAPLSVTARSDDPAFDYVCRIFAPALGIPEDPVTGSAQCGLGPYWAAALGKTVLRGYQASARGGIVVVRVDGDRVRVGGPAVTVVRGELVD
jgi:PhzF family phenazine biosynthesis protein